MTKGVAAMGAALIVTAGAGAAATTGAATGAALRRGATGATTGAGAAGATGSTKPSWSKSSEKPSRSMGLRPLGVWTRLPTKGVKGPVWGPSTTVLTRGTWGAPQAAAKRVAKTTYLRSL